MKKSYIYLIKNSSHKLFKIGSTEAVNPLKRIRQYYSHNPEIDLINIWEVPNKHYEGKVRYELLKIFPKCKVKGQKEWQYGNIFKFEIDTIIEELKRKTHEQIN